MTLDQALSQLIEYGDDIESAYVVLASHRERTLMPFKLSKSHLIKVLAKFLKGDITSDDLSLWATIVDNQSNIDSHEIEDYLFALNNEEMMGDITKETIARMYTLLSE